MCSSDLYFIDIESSEYENRIEIQRPKDPRDLGRPFSDNSPAILLPSLNHLLIRSLSSTKKSTLPQNLIHKLRSQEELLRKLDLLTPYRHLSEQELDKAASIISVVQQNLRTENQLDPKMRKALSRWNFHMSQLMLALEIRYKELGPIKILNFLHGTKLFLSLPLDGVELMDMASTGAKLEIPILLEGMNPDMLNKQISLLLLDRSAEFLKSADTDPQFAHLLSIMKRLIRIQQHKMGLITPARISKSPGTNKWMAWSSFFNKPEDVLNSIETRNYKFYPKHLKINLPFIPKYSLSLENKLIFLSDKGQLALVSDENGLELPGKLKKHLSSTIGLEKFFHPIYGYETLKIWGLKNGKIMIFESSDGYEWMESSVPIPMTTLRPDQQIQILSSKSHHWYILSENGSTKHAWYFSEENGIQNFTIQELESEIFVPYADALFALKPCDKKPNCKPQWIFMAGQNDTKIPTIPANVDPSGFLVRDSEIFLSDKLSSRLFYTDGTKPFSPLSEPMGDPMAKLTLYNTSLVIVDRLGKIWILSENPSLDFLSRPRKF